MSFKEYLNKIEESKMGRAAYDIQERIVSFLEEINIRDDKAVEDVFNVILPYLEDLKPSPETRAEFEPMR